MKIVVTAGPTVEPIDAVRCITNYSSGKMGYAIAQAAANAGHDVTLISGPVSLGAPHGVVMRYVRTAAEMLASVSESFANADALVMTAAVCDFAPQTVHPGKLHRSEGLLSIALRPNPDILATVGATKGNRITVGFALEVEDGIASARRKCSEKNCDLVVLNSPSALDSSESSVTLVHPDGRVVPLPLLPKTHTAQILVSEIERIRSR
jgi:phosphopantothenoylcysteine decarboxylase/phosphopantothenate--cysteine ligase